MDLSQTHTTSEGKRLRQSNVGRTRESLGPYRSERAWGTVREDDSSYGTAWEYFPHDHARSRVHSACEGHCRSVSYDNRRPGRQRDVMQTWSDRANPAV